MPRGLRAEAPSLRWSGAKARLYRNVAVRPRLRLPERTPSVVTRGVRPRGAERGHGCVGRGCAGLDRKPTV
eukprot:scaffold1243_cov403-Prasinococcus_capsulatus_cf.AAC.11